MNEDIERPTPQRLAALVSALDDTARHEFATALDDGQLLALNAATGLALKAKIIDEMVEVMWAKLRELGVADRVNAVVFNAEEWDDGCFVDVHGVVHLTDGTVYGGAGDVEFDVEKHLTDLYGRVSPGFKVGFRMAGSSTGALPVEVYATEDAAEFAAEMHLPGQDL